jgi:hypothetical protein
MKKRHQSPDAYTYGTLLSGLNKHHRPRAIVKQAYGIYQNMLREGSKVEPNILHMNMMISIAGRAGDMERFWSVIRDIPETGPNTATTATYTSIFESLRRVNEAGSDSTEGSNIRDENEMMRAAHAVWSAAVDSWCKGTLEMNDEVVCAMARFLNSTSNVLDSAQVFSLIEQTTGIPKFIPPIQDKVASDFNTKMEALKLFNPITDKPHAILIQPTNRILDEILTSTQRLRRKRSGDYYWNSITGPSGFGLKPDIPCLKQYLRLFRITKSSKNAVNLITNWPNPSELATPVFRIAGATCQRNAWRPGTLKDATKLYSFRKSLFTWVDMKVLETFIQVIDVSLYTRDATNEERIEALQVLGSDLEDQLKLPGYGWYASGIEKTASKTTLDERTINLAKKVIGNIDYLVNNGFAIDLFSKTKNSLADFVRRYSQGKWDDQKSQYSRTRSTSRFVAIDKASRPKHFTSTRDRQ